MTTAIETPSRVVERVLGEGKAIYAAARARSSALADLGHPAVTVPLRILAKDGGVVVAHVPRVEGMDVATLLASRGSLRAGECVTLGTEVANALAAMHGAGLTHGDISAANVMVTDTGVVLVDTIAGAQPDERGTAPYSAPERPGGATPACDMYSVGVLLRECVSAADRDVIEAWTEPLIDRNPHARPAAVMVARALASCAAPEPLEVPPAGVAQAMRSRAQANRDRTLRLPAGRAWRVRTAVTKAVVIGAVGIASVAAAAIALSHVVEARTAEQPPPIYAPVVPVPAYGALTAPEAAQVLTEQRFEALVDGNAESLLATTSPAGTARGTVVAQAEAMRAQALAFEGLEVVVVHVTTLSSVGNEATVAVSYVVSDHVVVVEGVAEGVPAYEQDVVLDLTWLAGHGWLVEHARLRS